MSAFLGFVGIVEFTHVHAQWDKALPKNTSWKTMEEIQSMDDAIRRIPLSWNFWCNFVSLLFRLALCLVVACEAVQRSRSRGELANWASMTRESWAVAGCERHLDSVRSDESIAVGSDLPAAVKVQRSKQPQARRNEHAVTCSLA
jgi:hypothetical protein